MPRIAAALGVVITIAACIGFNTVRYPIVLEMAACSGDLGELMEKSPPATEEQDSDAATSVTPVLAALSGSADDPAHSPQYPDCSWDQCKSDRTSDVDSTWEAEPYHSDWDEDELCAEESSPTEPYPSDQSRQPDSLVPVAGSEQLARFDSRHNELSVDSAPMYRLPSPSQIEPARYGQEHAEMGGGSIPFYPSTGCE
jgi:hypothetical protein